MKPAYLKLSIKELEEKADKAWQLMNPCRVCPRSCGVDRANDQKQGFCRTGSKPKVYSAHPHFGEESCLVSTGGSGTVFFSSCNLACVYCQNPDISQLRLGREIEFEDLSEMMLSLQSRGCHNINFVSPTIWVPHILKALVIARKKGLKLPLVYNTGGYDSAKTLKILNGIIDIYMPDIKYSDSKRAQKYSLAPNYRATNQKAVKEMYRQVGDLAFNKRGLATRGLLIRHLVLPENIAGTQEVMRFIAKVSKNTFVNIMDQYHPANKAGQHPQINRRITSQEFSQAVEFAKKEGLTRLERSKPRSLLHFP